MAMTCECAVRLVVQRLLGVVGRPHLLHGKGLCLKHVSCSSFLTQSLITELSGSSSMPSNTENAVGAVISAMAHRQFCGNLSDCKLVKNNQTGLFPMKMPNWQENVSGEHTNFISSLCRRALEGCATALLKHFPSLQVLVNKRSKTQAKDVVLKVNLSGR